MLSAAPGDNSLSSSLRDTIQLYHRNHQSPDNLGAGNAKTAANYVLGNFKSISQSDSQFMASSLKKCPSTYIERGSLGMTCSSAELEPRVGQVFLMNGLPYRKRLTRSRLGFRSWRGRKGEKAQRENWLGEYFEEADLEEKRRKFERRKRKLRAFGKRSMPLKKDHDWLDSRMLVGKCP